MNIWEKVRLFFSVLNLIRFNFLVILIGTAFVFIDQGQEVLISMGEINGEWQDYILRAVFLLATVLYAFSVWYSARIMFLFNFGTRASHSDCYPRFKKHLPRLLGFLVLILVAIALLMASDTLYWLAATLAGIAILFLIVVYDYKDYLGLNVLIDDFKDLSTFTALPTITKIIITALLILNILLMILFIKAPILTVNIFFLNAASIVLIAMSLTTVTGNTITYYGNRYNVPVLWLLAITLIVFSLFNDNHRVRQEKNMRSHDFKTLTLDSLSKASTAPKRPLEYYDSLEKYFKDWIIEPKNKYGTDPVPVFIVTAEGGGIRAAYWTALVLSELQDRDKTFPRHVFAISGVSGGSLGGAVFDALLVSEPEGGAYTKNRTMRNRADRILAEDFLSPTVATLLFPDLLQRFMPLAFLDDRAMTLEAAWEKAWTKEAGNIHFSFSDPFINLWGKQPFHIPLLFLNSTVVETGQRIIVNPLYSGNNDDEFNDDFSHALNATSLIGDRIPLSTAVHMSARFTYVSPAGSIKRLDRPGKDSWIRVVDGGYFENSGAVTANEILTKIQNAAEEHEANIKIVVIQIRNSPIPIEKDREENYDKRIFVSEVLSPVQALLHVREARGYQAREELSQRVGDNNFNFTLCKLKGTTLPLGWMLSKKARDEMEKQLTGRQGGKATTCDKTNKKNLDKVIKLLK